MRPNSSIPVELSLDSLPDFPRYTHFIYSLSDPASGEVRYIGRSCNLRERFWSHCSATSKGALSDWVYDLRERGQRPAMSIVDAVSPDDSREPGEVEWEWIRYFAHNGGAHLLNFQTDPRWSRNPEWRKAYRHNSFRSLDGHFPEPSDDEIRAYIGRVQF